MTWYSDTKISKSSSMPIAMDTTHRCLRRTWFHVRSVLEEHGFMLEECVCNTGILWMLDQSNNCRLLRAAYFLCWISKLQCKHQLCNSRAKTSKEVIYPSSMYSSLAQGYLCSHFSFGNHNNKYPHEFQKLIHVPRDARPNIIVIYVLLAVNECSNCFKLSASHVKRIV